ncbi:glycosyl transferase family 39 [Candidatus Omnitrophus magneticus]|uniref:Glycosyl transferase family 39 n=1 Tax=Candidatus Omnitrophus magneticus TaxID=1609969 RepID=A0A0F0CUP8_9BACT|nr:glycosyl transferase family 39 [Candidatus Omnitrophus magneticus]
MKIVINILLLAIISSFIFFLGLGLSPLTDPDETFYAETAKEMLKTNETITPVIFGKPQFEKPVFYYWLLLISYNIFGVNEFAARFPSGVFALFGIIGIFFLGRFLYSSFCGLISAFIMATSVIYIVLARACVTDMVLGIFILYSFLFFVAGEIKQKRLMYLLSSAMAAFGVLTKGPIAFLIIAGVIIPYLIIVKRKNILAGIPFVECIIIFSAIAFPWYIIMYKTHGNLFLNEFFGFHNITRFLVPEHKIGSSPFFYIPIILAGFFPWTAFLPAGIYFTKKMDIDRTFTFKRHNLFLWLWFFMIFIFFSISSTKLVTYIFPLFPVLALITGRFIAKYLKDLRNIKTFKLMKVSYYFFLLSSFIALIIIFFVIKHEYPEVSKEILLTEMIFGMGLILSLFYFLKEKRKSFFVTIVGTVIILIFPLTFFLVPLISENESSKTLSYKYLEVAFQADALGGENDHRGGIAFYTGKEDIADIHPYSSLVTFFKNKERVWGIIQKKHFEQLQKNKEDIYVESVSSHGKYLLVTNKPYTN